MRVIYFLSKKDLNFFEKEKRLVVEVNVEGRAFHILCNHIHSMNMFTQYFEPVNRSIRFRSFTFQILEKKHILKVFGVTTSACMPG